MAKHTKDELQAQVALPEDGAAPESQVRQPGESLIEFAARAKAEAAARRAETSANKPRKPDGTPATVRRQVDEDAVADAYADFTNGIKSVAELSESLHKAGLWSEKEATTIYMLSAVDEEPATQKDVAVVLNCNTWMVFNYRRDALVKLGAVLGEDWEALHEPLRIRRGAAKPERHTQYWAPVTEEEKKLRKELHDAEVAQRKLDRAAAKSTAKPS